MKIGVIKVISSSFDKFKRLIIKSQFMGAITNGQGDVKTPVEASPFGIDSNPTDGKRGLFVTTSTIGKYYIIGYFNTNRKAEVGETRLFSTSNTGDFSFNIWLRTDGTTLIGNGSDPSAYTNFAVYFNELKTEFNKLKADYNDLVTKVNANASLLGTHTHPYVNGVTPAVTSPSGVAGQTGSANTSNIDSAKNSTIKYK